MTEQAKLLRLADFLAEAVMATTDEELLAEAEEDGFDLEESRLEMVAMVDRIEAGLGVKDCSPNNRLTLA